MTPIVLKASQVSHFANSTTLHVYRQTMSGTFLQNYKPDIKIADMKFARADLKISIVLQ